MLSVILLAYFFWAELSQPQFPPARHYVPTPARLEAYNELAGGFADGHLHLHTPPPEGLTRLSNPYDPSLNYRFRLKQPGSELPGVHDISLYHGKFYLYFSAAPALLFFLPGKLISGVYLPERYGCAFFCAIGLLAQFWMLRFWCERQFNRASITVFSLCVAGLGLVNLAPIILRRPSMWELPICCAYAFTSLALALLSYLITSKRVRLHCLYLLSLLAGLAICARPTAIPMGLVLVVAGLWILKREKATLSRATSVAVALLLPISCLGLAELWYNYARFGNPLEFGMKYQLSGEVYGVVTYGVGFIGYNLKLYFLQPPFVRSRFPFLEARLPQTFPPGHLGVESVIGVFVCVPVTLFMIYEAWVAWRSRENEAYRLFCFVSLATSVGTVLFLSAFAGACLRYQVEFVPVLALLSLLGILRLEHRFVGRSCLPWLRSGWCLLLTFSCAFVLLERNVPLRFIRREWAKEMIEYIRQ